MKELYQEEIILIQSDLELATKLQNKVRKFKKFKK